MIREEVEERIAKKGWEREEREFSPHITLARFSLSFCSTSLEGGEYQFSY